MNLIFHRCSKLLCISLLVIPLLPAFKPAALVADPSMIPESILSLENQDDEGLRVSIETLDEKNHFGKGDSIHYSLFSNKRCYVCVLSFQADGSWLVIYPNPYESEIMLEPNEPRIIPDPDNSNYQFIVDAPYGTDTICVIASTVEAELSLKIAELSKAQPMFVSLHRGVFPKTIQANTHAIGNNIQWDIDWISIQTSEIRKPEKSLLLTRTNAIVIMLVGFGLLLTSVFLLRKRII